MSQGSVFILFSIYICFTGDPTQSLVLSYTLKISESKYVAQTSHPISRLEYSTAYLTYLFECAIDISNSTFPNLKSFSLYLPDPQGCSILSILYFTWWQIHSFSSSGQQLWNHLLRFLISFGQLVRKFHWLFLQIQKSTTSHYLHCKILVLVITVNHLY